MSRSIRPLAILAAVLLPAALAPALGAGAERHAAGKVVPIKDFEFAPAELTITAGDTITWENNGPRPHTATSLDGTFDSGNLDAGQTFSATFANAGTFIYACRYHDIMQGTITVVAPAPTPTAAPTGQVTASDQPVVGGAITLAQVSAGQASWVVAQLDQGGKPGKVLGQTLVKAGTNANVQIRLSQAVDVGARLWLLLRLDAGTPGSYEFPGPDGPVHATGGQIVMQQISVTAAPARRASPAPPASPPRTGAMLLPLGILALLLAGGLLALRMRRH
jgi:plastocyanin